MDIKEYRLPAAPGDVLCDPPLADWEGHVGAHLGRVPGWTFTVLGMPGKELRRRTRRRLWGKSDRDPLIVTGHQPVFFHAGVWIKTFAVRYAAAVVPGAAGYNVNVDSDYVSELDMWLPGGEGNRLVRRRIGLGLVPGQPLERQPVPGEAEWEALVGAGRDILGSLPEEAGRDVLLGRWNRFADTLRRERDPKAAVGVKDGGLARFMASCRRLLEEQGAEAAATGFGLASNALPPLGETYVSSVAETPEFARFALAWMAEADKLLCLYNDLLGRYRRRRGYRSKANPFPDLRRYGEQIEVPFWCADPREGRADVFVIPGEKAGRLTLTTRHGPLLEVDTTSPDEAAEQLLAAGQGLRPKAVPLTMFLRVFASDLFVHGVGGGRYDHVTDGVIRGWWGIEPPRYAVVSASLPLPLAGSGAGTDGKGADRGEGGGESPSHWRARLWALRYNPQRFVDAGGTGLPGHEAADAELARLKAEKMELIEAIGRPGAPKRQLTRRIEAVNEALHARLQGVEEAWREELRRAEERRRRRAVELARDYPFFLHDPAGLWRALRHHDGK